MSNAIQTVADKQALDGLDALISKLEKADALLLKSAKDALEYSKSIGGVKTPGGLSTVVAENTKYTDELQRQAKVIDMLEKSIVGLTAARKTAAQSGSLEAVNQRQLNTNATQQAKLVSNLIGAYDKLSLQLQIASKDALNLGATYGRNSIEFTNAAIKVNKLDAEIKALDADIGRNQRNVGNYKSGFNGLGNALNQITRELPAFTFSAQTGFLALSNNIPILVDQIQGLVAVNKQLVAEGKPVTSVFKQIASQLFSFNTVLALVILGTTLFGDKISEAFKNIGSGSKNLDVATESAKRLRDASIEGSKNAVAELVGLQNNLAIAKDVNLSYKERSIAVENLQKQYPFYFENLTKEQILAGQTAAAERELTEAIIARAKANAAIGKITENESKIIDIEQRQLDIVKERIAAQKDLQREQAASNGPSSGQVVAGVNQGQLNARVRLSALDREEKANRKELNALNAINNKLTEYTLKQQKEAIGLDYQQEKSRKAAAKAGREDIEAASANLKAFDPKGIIEIYEEQIRVFQELQLNLSDTSEDYKRFQIVIDGLRQSIDLIKDPSKVLKAGTEEFNRQVNGARNLAKAMDELREKTQGYLDTFSLGFLEDSGFGSLTKFFDKTFSQMIYGAENTRERFQIAFAAISETFQETFNFLSKLSQENFEAEYARVEKQKDIAIAFAGESEAAKVEAAEQAEKQKAKIKKREAEAEKKLRLFNAVIDTAQAVVAALPNIPLSILVGLIGAAKIALISSQQIPEFWQGGIHDGGLMRVNDDPFGKKGNNYKEVVKTPSGSVIKPQGKNVLMSAPAGSEIFPDYASFEAHENQLNRLLFGAGISPSSGVRSFDAMQRAQPTLTPGQYFAGVARTEAAIRNFSPIHITKDRRGEIIHQGNQQARQQSMNNRLNIIGKTNP